MVTKVYQSVAKVELNKLKLPINNICHQESFRNQNFAYCSHLLYNKQITVPLVEKHDHSLCVYLHFAFAQILHRKPFSVAYIFYGLLLTQIPCSLINLYQTHLPPFLRPLTVCSSSYSKRPNCILIMKI